MQKEYFELLAREKRPSTPKITARLDEIESIIRNPPKLLVTWTEE